MTAPGDILRERLRAADPAGRDVQASMGDSLSNLVEAIVNETQETTARRPGTSRRVLWAVAASIAVVAASAAAYLAVAGDNTHPTKTPNATRAHSVVALKLPASGGGTSIGSCIRFSVDVLAQMPVAFDGSAIEVKAGQVTLDVNHWYRGGTADQVELTSPDGAAVSLEGVVRFVKGGRYLVTATNGTVNACGFTAEWSADLAKSFQQAFGS